MVKTREISTGKTVRETVADLRYVFQDWGLDRHDWEVTELRPGKGYEVKFWLPYAAEPHIIRLYTQRTPEGNLRGCFMFVEALQKNALRGVQAEHAGVQYLSLPPGAEEAPSGNTDGEHRGGRSAQRGARFRGLREACEFLDVRENSDQETADTIYRARARRAHPDTGGTEEAMKELVEARDMIYARRGFERVAREAQ